MDLLNLDVAREYLGVLLQGLAVTVGLTLSVITMSCLLAIPDCPLPDVDQLAHPNPRQHLCRGDKGYSTTLAACLHLLCTAQRRHPAAGHRGGRNWPYLQLHGLYE